MKRGKSIKKQIEARSLRVELKAIWDENNFGPGMPFNVQKLSRELAARLNYEIVPGTKIAVQIINQFRHGERPVRRAAAPKRNRTPSKADKETFYSSWEWRTIRMKALKKFGASCMCCGATPGHKDMAGKPVKIVVDHIKPLHKNWDLRLDEENLQILCDECNQGKGAWDTTDYRPSEAPDEWIIEDNIPMNLRDQLAIRH